MTDFLLVAALGVVFGPAAFAEGGEIRPFKRLRLSEYRLTADTSISVDELILDGPLYTEGFRFAVDARRIHFHPMGAIRTYSQAAPKGTVGMVGPDEPARVGTQADRHGAPGIANLAAGGQGSAGAGGAANPGEILLVADSLTGSVKIDGAGQAGGQGGQGGRGGRGGRGGDGANARVRCNFTKERHDGGNSGRGGRGGVGGKGGTGGDGGPPVPVTIFTDQKAFRATVSDPSISTRPGLEGLGGEPGIGGPGGEPGHPGTRDECSYSFLKRREARGGVSGGVGEVGPAGEFGDKGKSHAVASVETALIVDIQPLIERRSNVVKAWAQYSLVRRYFHLLSSALNLALGSETSKAELFRAVTDPTATLSLGARANKETLDSIAYLWRNTLIEAIDHELAEPGRPSGAAEQLRALHADATRLYQYLTRISSEWPKAFVVPAGELLGPLKSNLQRDLENALQACQLLDRQKTLERAKGLRTPLKGDSISYSFPVCENLGRFQDAELVFSELALPGESAGESTDPKLSAAFTLISSAIERDQAFLPAVPGSPGLASPTSIDSAAFPLRNVSLVESAPLTLASLEAEMHAMTLAIKGKK